MASAHCLRRESKDKTAVSVRGYAATSEPGHVTRDDKQAHSGFGKFARLTTPIFLSRGIDER